MKIKLIQQVKNFISMLLQSKLICNRGYLYECRDDSMIHWSSIDLFIFSKIEESDFYVNATNFESNDLESETRKKFITFKT